jgi:hypothetical protein
VLVGETVCSSEWSSVLSPSYDSLSDCDRSESTGGGRGGVGYPYRRTVSSEFRGFGVSHEVNAIEEPEILGRREISPSFCPGVVALASTPKLRRSLCSHSGRRRPATSVLRLLAGIGSRIKSCAMVL